MSSKKVNEALIAEFELLHRKVLNLSDHEKKLYDTIKITLKQNALEEFNRITGVDDGGNKLKYGLTPSQVEELNDLSSRADSLTEQENKRRCTLRNIQRHMMKTEKDKQAAQIVNKKIEDPLLALTEVVEAMCEDENLKIKLQAIKNILNG